MHPKEPLAGARQWERREKYMCRDIQGMGRLQKGEG